MGPRARKIWGLLLLSGLAALVALGLTASMGPPPDNQPHPFNQDRNAVWLEHRWLARPQPAPDVEATLLALARHGVRYVYPHLIPFDRAGRLPPHSREQMRAFQDVAHGITPRVRVLPWVGGLRVGYRRTDVGGIDLGDLAQRQQIVAECRGLIDEGFDGVHLNIEPVPNDSDDLLALLRALRPALGDNHILSVSATRPAPISVPGAPNFAWTPEYLARVAALADQIVIMGYDTGLPTAGLYRRYMAYAVAASAEAVKPTARARLLIGVPTYTASGFMHRTDVETLENALFGVIAGLRGSGVGGTVEGVALYAHWTTDREEWETYERLWRGGAGPAH